MGAVINFDKGTLRRIRRFLGLRWGRTTTVTVTYELITPARDCQDPAGDEVLMLDTLDHLSEYVMGFHDVAGFRLRRVLVNGRRAV